MIELKNILKDNFTLTIGKSTFSKEYLQKNGFNLYICGPTTYDYPHIGNLRSVLTFDILLRTLKFLEIDIKYVHNITDVDDKIIKRAGERKQDPVEFSSFFSDNYLELLKRLKIVMPNFFPKVSSEISGIKIFIQKIISKKFAYVNEGNVLFDLNKVDDIYLEETNIKRDKLKESDSTGNDFALWKKIDDYSFDSDWSKGRPGWHTECAYFIDKYFKSKTIDVHSGGVDLKFPHHENEKIQFYSINKKSIASEFVHVGQVLFRKNKMSKSDNNQIYVKDFILCNSINELKYIFFLTKYTKPINLSNDYFKNVKIQFSKISKFLKLSKSIDLSLYPPNYKILEDSILLILNDIKVSSVIDIINKLSKKINISIKKKLENDSYFSNLRTVVILLSILGID